MSNAAELALRDLERYYDQLAETIDRVPSDRVELLLTKLALVLGNHIGKPEVLEHALDLALKDL